MRTHLRAIVAFLPVCVMTAACGGSPTSPSGGALTSVTLSVTAVTVGFTVQGTVTLPSAAGSSARVALSSSNAAVASVPASVDVASGATTATFAVTGVSTGTATITASLNGTSRQSAPLTVTAGLQLASITVNPSTVAGGANVLATVTLTGPAPPAGAVVALSSDGTAVVPASAIVNSGDTSASFTVLTRVVSSPTTATIVGSFGGVSKTAAISLTKPTVATANFGVTGQHVTETCAVINNGTALDCTFDGSTSSAPGTITAYDWTWTVGGTITKTQTSSGPLISGPAFSCTMLPAPPLPASGSLTMTVTLKIHDDQGNVSPVATDNGVRLLPQGSCGY